MVKAPQDFCLALPSVAVAHLSIASINPSGGRTNQEVPLLLSMANTAARCDLSGSQRARGWSPTGGEPVVSAKTASYEIGCRSHHGVTCYWAFKEARAAIFPSLNSKGDPLSHSLEVIAVIPSAICTLSNRAETGILRMDEKPPH